VCRGVAAFLFLLAMLGAIAPGAAAQEPVRIDSARFTFFAWGADLALARSLLKESLARDSFPGLPRPRSHIDVVIASDTRRFHELIGPTAPEWGAAIAVPSSHRVIMQGRGANSSAGDPRVTLRHEIAHLALHEMLGDLPPRWFDEGYAAYAAGEWGRDELLATNVALVLRGMPRLDGLDAYFTGGESRAQQGYALAERAVADLAALDTARGLSLFFGYWRETRSFDAALRRAYNVTESAFELKWRSNTRLRYGALALFADVSLGALALLLFIAPLWIMRRRDDRRRLEAMRVADAAQERRDRASVLALLLGDRGEGGGADGNAKGTADDSPVPNDDPVR
jgi:hypothetical protein